jgi:hypothetical protein
MADWDMEPMTEKERKAMEKGVRDGYRNHPDDPATIRGRKWLEEQERLEREAGHELPPH